MFGFVVRVFDLVVQPSSQASPDSAAAQVTPPRPISSWAAPRSVTKAPELSLLQTPQVVKVSAGPGRAGPGGGFCKRWVIDCVLFLLQRARALAASAPVFSSFTPQSILRTSLRPTPVATPSASPGRSVTPPPRPKESRITFMEGAESPDLPKSSVHWSNGVKPNTLFRRRWSPVSALTSTD